MFIWTKRISLRALVGALAVMFVHTAPLAAQQAGGSDAQQITSTINRLFDAMRAGDSAAARTAFDSSAKLIAVDMRQNPVKTTTVPVAEFLQAIGKPHDKRWDERPINPITHIDGALAVVWTEYTFHLGDRFSHCGTDTFQLIRGESGWKIISIAYTHRQEGCKVTGAE